MCSFIKLLKINIRILLLFRNLIFDVEFKIEFLTAQISDYLPFNMLIGRELLDKLNAYFLGKKQILCLKIAD
jgi:hypothetical protein